MSDQERLDRFGTHEGEVTVTGEPEPAVSTQIVVESGEKLPFEERIRREIEAFNKQYKQG